MDLIFKKLMLEFKCEKGKQNVEELRKAGIIGENKWI
jgi:hypothetical protein